MTTRGLRVLVVEDDGGDAAMIEAALSEHPRVSTVGRARDGSSALMQLRQAVDASAALPDLLLLDLGLPGLDGHEVLAAVRHDEHLCHLPVVVLTSSTARHDIVSAYRGAASAYFVKPAERSEFVASLGRLVEYWAGAALATI